MAHHHQEPINQEIKSIINNKLSTQFPMNTITHIPLTNVTTQLDHTFLVSIEKENKTQVILLLITIKNKKYNILIVKDNNTMFSVFLKFNHVLYTGTIFEGDLIYNNRWIFYVTDIYYYLSKFTLNLSFKNRLQIISNCVKNDLKFDMLVSFCDVHLSSFFLFNHIPLISKSCKLLFQSDTTNKKFYYHFEKKNDKKQYCGSTNEIKTFTVYSTTEIDVYKIFDNKNVSFGILAVTSQAMSDHLSQQFKDTQQQQNIKCKYNNYFNAWMII
jgi:hypothetical protein